MSWLSELFGGNKNPADTAKPYINQIPGQTIPYYTPYYQSGVKSLPVLEGEYNKNITNPGKHLNEFGAEYTGSPGLKFAIQQALQAAGHAAASGGMAGSPEHEQVNMQLATDIQNKDFYNWLDKVLGLYGTGVTGEEGMANRGLNSTKDITKTIAETLGQQGDLGFRGTQEENANRNSWISSLGGIGGALVGGTLGGPFGAFTGYNVGKEL